MSIWDRITLECTSEPFRFFNCSTAAFAVSSEAAQMERAISVSSV